MFSEYLLIVFCVYNVVIVESNLKDKIYFELDSTEYSMCFKRFNETHQIGCSSHRHGHVGILRLLETDEDLEWLRSKNNNDHYVVLMNLKYFTGDIIKEFIQLKRIVGVMLDGANKTHDLPSFSSDLKIPNQGFNIYNSSGLEWNSFGNELMFVDIPFPIAILSNSTTIDFMKECFRRHNDEVDGAGRCPWCAIRMKSFMNGAVNSIVCHRRTIHKMTLNPEGYCDPLGNYNVLSSVGHWKFDQPFKKGSVIMVAARLDSFSMFENISPGFDSSMTSFVALHTIAEVMGNIKDKLMSHLDDNPIIFALFHGEAFDYTGSSRLVYDMENKRFTYFDLESINYFIELGQLGVQRYTKTAVNAWVHIDEDINKASIDKLNSVVKILTDQSSSDLIRLVKSTHKLPPSSLQTFLKKNPNITGVVISNHEAAYSNRFYNSFLDDNYNLDMFTQNLTSSEMYNTLTTTGRYIQSVASSVSCTIYMLVTNSSNCQGVPKANLTYVNNLFYCFGKDPTCELFNSSTLFDRDGSLLQKEFFKHSYVGVMMNNAPHSTWMHRLLLARSIGSKVNLTMCYQGTDRTVNDTTYFKLNGDLNSEGVRFPSCVAAHSTFSMALSPSYDDENELPQNSGFPMWMESRWDASAYHIDVFLLPCFSQEVKTVLLGLAVVLLFIPIIGFVNYRLFRAI